MKTVINNYERVFQIVDSFNRSIFCNLKDISTCIDENDLRAGYFKIYHFWDSKQKVVSKKYINEMLVANNLEPLK